MAKTGKRVIVLLKSSESAHVYTTTKNRRTTPHKLEFRKYDPVVRRHVIYREKK